MYNLVRSLFQYMSTKVTEIGLYYVDTEQTNKLSRFRTRFTCFSSSEKLFVKQ